jgi:hypothetical protein
MRFNNFVQIFFNGNETWRRQPGNNDRISIAK